MTSTIDALRVRFPVGTRVIATDYPEFTKATVIGIENDGTIVVRGDMHSFSLVIRRLKEDDIEPWIDPDLKPLPDEGDLSSGYQNPKAMAQADAARLFHGIEAIRRGMIGIGLDEIAEVAYSLHNDW